MRAFLNVNYVGRFTLKTVFFKIERRTTQKCTPLGRGLRRKGVRFLNRLRLKGAPLRHRAPNLFFTFLVSQGVAFF